MPELRKLLIGDDPKGWQAAGFEVTDDKTTIGTIEIQFVEGVRSGLIGLELTDVVDGSIDGIAISSTDAEPAEPIEHQNQVSRMDHVVVMTPDIGRTIHALEAAGFEARRTRDVPGTSPARRQVFLWAGDTILEVVGPIEPTGTGPASIWGLALTTDDMAAAVSALNDRLTTPKPAVQPGREIATVKTKDLGISLALAMMTPHVDPRTVESTDA